MADDDDDEYGGSTHLKNFLSESQTSAPSTQAGGFGNSPKRKLRGFTDDAIEKHYGKEIDMTPGADQTVNRSGKGNRLK